MGKLFGTDGIRGLANEPPIDPETGLKLGRALAYFCRNRGLEPVVVLGRDTRISGHMLENAITSGVLSEGGDVFSVGTFPTPGVAFLTRDLEAAVGIVVSASHNPYPYNGFKIFGHNGLKLSEDEEAEIEDLILTPAPKSPRKKGPSEPGELHTLQNASDRYIRSLMRSVPDGLVFENMNVVVDCSNGATWKIVPRLFSQLGSRATVLSEKPDGKNINQDCGSQHTETLSRKVLKTGARVGLAVDGDGDRLVAVDENGKALTGDQIMVIFAKVLKQRGELLNNLVVSTIMSNIGFHVGLEKLGIRHLSAQVGDRNVMETMRAAGAVLGGEESGHVIFLEHHTTGDGLLSALQLISAMIILDKPLSELARLMRIFPQTTVNVPVSHKPELAGIPGLDDMIEMAEKKLLEKGRVLVRYSGTEPVCRVMVEGENKEEVEKYARDIAQMIQKNLG